MMGEAERGEGADLEGTGLVIAYGINSLAVTLASSTFNPLTSLRYGSYARGPSLGR